MLRLFVQGVLDYKQQLTKGVTRRPRATRSRKFVRTLRDTMRAYSVVGRHVVSGELQHTPGLQMASDLGKNDPRERH